MSESTISQSPGSGGRHEFWNEVIWPTARGLESFLWKLLWFAVIVCLLFSYNPFRGGTQEIHPPETFNAEPSPAKKRPPRDVEVIPLVRSIQTSPNTLNRRDEVETTLDALIGDAGCDGGEPAN